MENRLAHAMDLFRAKERDALDEAERQRRIDSALTGRPRSNVRPVPGAARVMASVVGAFTARRRFNRCEGTA
jgi:hypothetical protein